jgi:hypothetical protein
MARRIWSGFGPKSISGSCLRSSAPIFLFTGLWRVRAPPSRLLLHVASPSRHPAAAANTGRNPSRVPNFLPVATRRATTWSRSAFWSPGLERRDLRGRPMDESNLGSSIGRRGLTAPGDSITSLSTEGLPLTLGGTSVAVPFVTGTIGLLWSEFPAAPAAQIKLAISQASAPRRASIVPRLLDAAAAYQILLTANARR